MCLRPSKHKFILDSTSFMGKLSLHFETFSSFHVLISRKVEHTGTMAAYGHL